jgi:hypothetical protein
MDESLLRITKIAFAVDRLRKSSSITDDAVKRSAKDLLKGWQQLTDKKTTKEKEGKKSSGKKTTSATESTSGRSGSDDVERDAPIDFKITAGPPKRNKHG